MIYFLIKKKVIQSADNDKRRLSLHLSSLLTVPASGHHSV